jgi:hypothetical protein
MNRLSTIPFVLLCAACSSSDPTDSGGSGSVAFHTYGEDYIEQMIPADEPAGQEGFADGWSVKFDRFLVNIQNVSVKTASGSDAGGLPGSKVFNMVIPGNKPIVRLESVEAQAWDAVGYEIAPATAASELGEGAVQADKDTLVNGGFSVFVEGTATKGTISKHIAWGFDLGTRYTECRSEQEGKDQLGIVVTKGQTAEVELTIHADHFFYDRLQASEDPSIPTKIRFDAIAAADDDSATPDDEVTLEELEAKVLDVTLYDPSGFSAANHRAFVESLVRTIGHFRGEGECTVSQIE